MANVPVKDSRFAVFNGDAKGTVIEADSKNVTYFFDHDIKKVWVRDLKDHEKNTYPIESN